jgi:hypothetical protein
LNRRFSQIKEQAKNNHRGVFVGMKRFRLRNIVNAGRNREKQVKAKGKVWNKTGIKQRLQSPHNLAFPIESSNTVLYSDTTWNPHHCKTKPGRGSCEKMHKKSEKPWYVNFSFSPHNTPAVMPPPHHNPS